MLRIALSAALLCAPVAALAGEPAPKAPPAVAAASDGAGSPPAETLAAPVKALDAKPAKKLICRREQGTGARTAAPKVCLTKEQWKAIDSEG